MSSELDTHFGDKAVLNAILRSMDSSSNYTSLTNYSPPGAARSERDHFFEIQHIIDICMESPPLFDVNALYEIPMGFFIVLSTFANDHRNMYLISKAENQAKKRIALSEYAPAKHNATISAYLSMSAVKGHGTVLVIDNLKALVMEFAVREEKYARLAANVAVRIGVLMGWIDIADVNTGSDGPALLSGKRNGRA